MCPCNTLDDLSVAGKRALVRVDFNVPVNESGAIINDRRIRAALPTIHDLLDREAAVILMTHLGRPSGSDDASWKLDRVVRRLQRLLPGRSVTKCHQVVGAHARRAAQELLPGGVLVLENLRFHPGEKNADEDFARELHSLGDLYINDAFATCHRKHASTYVLPQLFENERRAIGRLVELELSEIDHALRSSRTPVIAILGGAKVSDKLGAAEALLGKLDVDRLLIGGTIAHTFLQAKGISIGQSSVQQDELESVRELIGRFPIRFVLPTDHVIADQPRLPANIATSEGDIPSSWYGLDIGPFTVDSFTKSIGHAGTIVWNGPLGKFEEEPFREGTVAIARAIAASSAVSLIGGGATSAAVERFGLTEKMTHVSTAGGAFLQYLEFGTLPALSVLEHQPKQLLRYLLKN